MPADRNANGHIKIFTNNKNLSYTRIRNEFFVQNL